MKSEKFEMVAKTFQGLEDVLAAELTRLGAENVTAGRRMVSFEGDNEMLYKANFCCRTALRILKPICKFTASDPDTLYDMVKEMDWGTLLSVDKTFSIDPVVNSDTFTHSRYVTYRVKDAIVDYFQDRLGEGKRPGVRLQDADVMINVHIDGNRVTMSLDSSGESLHKRGYRVAQTEAPINEVLAAGILLKAGYDGQCPLVDPMCGSGTFLIEAAMIAANINPGVYRQHYAFETWEDFDKELFSALYNDDSGERTPGCRILGGDIARAAVAVAQKNIEAAGVEEFVSVECKPFAEWTEPPVEGILVTNPPYGERLRPDDMAGLYKGIGSTLKNYFKGYHAWIIGYRDEYFREIGLKPSVKFPILNGALECELREYVLFEGSYAQFREDGGSVANRHFDREPRHKVRRMTDREWDRESRKFGGKDHGRDRDRDRSKDHDRSRKFEKRQENRRTGEGGGREFDRNRGFGKERGRDFDRTREGFDNRKDSRRDGFKRGDGFKRREDAPAPRRERTSTDTLGKMPSLPESSATVFENRRFRPRKGWKKDEGEK